MTETFIFWLVALAAVSCFPAQWQAWIGLTILVRGLFLLGKGDK